MKTVEIVVGCSVTKIMEIPEDKVQEVESPGIEKLMELERAIKEELDADKVDVTDIKVFTHGEDEKNG